MMAITTIFIYLFYKKYSKKLHPLKHILAVIFSLCCVIGNSYQEVSSWNLVFSTVPLFLISIMQVFCYYYLIKTIFCFIDTLLERKRTIKVNTNNKLVKLFQEHPFLFSLIVMLLFWLIYMIAFYPLILSKDPSFQIKQFFNVKTKYIDYVIPLSDKVNLTNHHPVFHTMLLGGSIKLGRLLGSDNLGLFIYAIMQSITLASSLAYTIYYLYKKKKSFCSVKAFTKVFILLMIYSLVPMFPFYAMSAVKDTLYTAVIIFFVITLFTILDDKETKTSKYIVLLLLSILLYLLRNNGIYVVVGTILVLAIYRRKEFIYLTAVLLFVISTYISYDKILLPALKIPAGSIRETLSVPFQQTARYVKEHNSEVTEEEKNIIDRVLEYDTLAKRYNPVHADSVKNKFNKDASDEDLRNYFSVWGKQLLKHPTTYIQATLNNYYGYVYPECKITEFTTKYIVNNDTRLNGTKKFNYKYISKYKGLRKIVKKILETIQKVPVISWITNIAFNVWAIILMIVYMCYTKKYRYIICMMPIVSIILVNFASPVNAYFRYAMPYIFSMPLILSIFLDIVKEKGKGKK